MPAAPERAPVVLHCPSKLNLFLEVLARRPDGFHDIETVMVPGISRDTLTAERVPGGAVELDLRFEEGEVPDPAVPGGAENLALRAARLLLDEAGHGEGVRLTLVKGIPAGAGLGGGSSDAAGALRAVNRLLGDPVGEERLAALALSLGSDVPYFLRGGAVLARGRGERLETVPMARGLRFVVQPGSGPVSTAEVYARCRPAPPGERRDPGPVLAALAAGDAEALAAACFNRLEAPAREVSPALARHLDFLRSLGIGPIHMSGSGSACFLVIPPGSPGRTMVRAFKRALIRGAAPPSADGTA